MARRITITDNMPPLAIKLVEANMTKKALAEKSGVPLGTIDQWVRRIRTPRDVYQLYKVAQALGCRIEDIIEPEFAEASSETKIEGENRKDD